MFAYLYGLVEVINYDARVEEVKHAIYIACLILLCMLWVSVSSLYIYENILYRKICIKRGIYQKVGKTIFGLDAYTLTPIASSSDIKGELEKQ